MGFAMPHKCYNNEITYYIILYRYVHIIPNYCHYNSYHYIIGRCCRWNVGGCGVRSIAFASARGISAVARALQCQDRRYIICTRVRCMPTHARRILWWQNGRKSICILRTRFVYEISAESVNTTLILCIADNGQSLWHATFRNATAAAPPSAAVYDSGGLVVGERFQTVYR